MKRLLAVVSIALAGTVLLGPGCKKGPATGPQTAPGTGSGPPAPAGAGKGNLDKAVDFWASGTGDAAAVEELSTVDWKGTSAAHRGSLFRLTEKELVAMPVQQREPKIKDLMGRLNILRELCRHMFDQAAQASAAHKPDDARKLLEAIDKCGVFLADDAGRAALSKAVGRGLKRRASEELGKLPSR